jgi:hypothetical protein
VSGPPPALRVWATPEADALVELATRLTTVPRHTITGPLHRGVFLKHVTKSTPPRPLFYEASVGGRRYTPVGGPAGVYLSFDPATPAAELQAFVFDDRIIKESYEHDPFVVYAARARIGGLLDLTDSATCVTLDVTMVELDENWVAAQDLHTRGAGPRPAGQLLALATHLTCEFSGIIYRSRRSPYGKNVVVFPDRLFNDEYIEVVDSERKSVERMTGTAIKPGPRG